MFDYFDISKLLVLTNSNKVEYDKIWTLMQQIKNWKSIDVYESFLQIHSANSAMIGKTGSGDKQSICTDVNSFSIFFCFQQCSNLCPDFAMFYLVAIRKATALNI